MKVYFYYPSKIIGGCELLMVRLCRICQNAGIDAAILCKEGEIYWETGVAEGLIRVAHLDLVEDAGYPVIVTPISEAAQILSSQFKKEIKDCSFIFAVTHPQLLNKRIPLLSPIFFKLGVNPFTIYKLLLPFDFLAAKKLLQLTNFRSGAFYVVPQFKHHYEKEFNVELNSWTYLPIPISIKRETEILRDFQIGASSNLRLTYIGRVEDAQVSILKHLMKELFDESINVTIQLKIIGEGRNLSEIESFAAEIQNSNVSFQFMGKLTPYELDKILIKDTDIVFAAGTSALEGASRGVPTCLLDGSFHPIDRYRFRWIHTPSEFPLGCLLEDYPKYLGGSLSLADLILEYRRNAGVLSKSAYEWVKANHAEKKIEAILKTLLLLGGVKYVDLIKNGVNHSFYKYRVWRAIKKFRSNIMQFVWH